MEIELKHLNKTIAGQPILKDINLQLHDGEIVGLLGPNGAGKSTLMKILVGVWKADNACEVQAAKKEQIGYLPEQNPLYDEMYVREYLCTMLRMQKVENGRRLVEEVINKVGLISEANKRICELSKGYRQRVGIAQAILNNPQLVVLDEPTTGLDPNQLIEIRKVIKGLIKSEGDKTTIILSTHILQEVKEMCSRVVVINHGEIKADKPMGEIDNLEELFEQVTHEWKE